MDAAHCFIHAKGDFLKNNLHSNEGVLKVTFLTQRHRVIKEFTTDYSNEHRLKK